jgi:hypothetical protein
MNVNGPNPAPATAPEVPAASRRAVPVPKEAAVPKDKIVERPLNYTDTNVVVEMERNNTLVFKFIDEKTGKVFQQFPPEQMAQHQQAELPDLPGKGPGTKQA